VTVIFGIYALVLLAALLVAGRLSDHIGRRPVLIGATLAQVVTMGLFATASSVEGLLLARVVQGLATGAALAAIGAGMIDLDKARGPVANAVAPPLGTALGGLLAGLAVHFLPAPTLLIYVVLAVVFALQALGVMWMTETVTPRAGALASMRPQLAVPAATRRPLALAAPVLVAGWALAGFFGSLGPALLRSVFGLNASLAGGIAGFALAGSAAATVLALQHRAPRSVLNIGALGLLVGTAVIVMSLRQPSPTIFFIGTVVAGIGFGASFQGAIRSVVPTAQPHQRAGVLSVVFVVSYLAMSVPCVTAGFFVAHHAPLLLTAEAFGAMVAALAAVALLGSALQRERQLA
jgi:predicted MFS family arabinose efflux permease